MKQYEVITKARHLRYIYFVRDGYDSDKLYDLLWVNQNLWGGRLNPIVPVSNGEITEQWKDVIRHHDPDYILYIDKVSEKYICDLCHELSFNPIEIKLLDVASVNIDGVSAGHLFDFFPDFNLRMISITDYEKPTPPLKRYFELNYLITTAHKSQWPNRIFDKASYSDDYSPAITFVSFPQNLNKSFLSSTNVSNTVLRKKQYQAPYFEIVIARDYSCFDDVIYYWNSGLYTSGHPSAHQLFVTIEQLDILVLHRPFGSTLDNANSPHNTIKLVSYSLSIEEMELYKEKLKAITKHCVFDTILKPLFPFEILDHKGSSNGSRETNNLQIISEQGNVVQNPKLSFGSGLEKVKQLWALDISISEITLTSKSLKFPYTFATHSICELMGRINREHSISLIIHSQINNESAFKISVPTPITIARHILTCPTIFGKIHNGFSEIAVNDVGGRLNGILNLFSKDFHAISELLMDKFWMDILWGLSTTSKIEGDTISFLEIIEQAKTIINNVELDYDPTFYNIESLKKGILNQLQQLSELKVFLLGYKIKCGSCSSKIWYSLDSIKSQVTCRGCSNKNAFVAETPISYKLNDLVKNNLAYKNHLGKVMPDGNLTVMKTLLHLNNKAYTSFDFLPQLDIYANTFGSVKTDLDVFCIVDGVVTIGECKNDSELFKDKKCLDNLLEVADIIKPGSIVISCSKDTNNRLEKSKHYLETNMKTWDYKPKIEALIVEPAHYYRLSSGSYDYFPD